MEYIYFLKDEFQPGIIEKAEEGITCKGKRNA
jgi:hypothetical protein